MKRTNFWLLLFLFCGGQAAAQTPYYQGKTSGSSSVTRQAARTTCGRA